MPKSNYEHHTTPHRATHTHTHATEMFWAISITAIIAMALAYLLAGIWALRALKDTPNDMSWAKKWLPLAFACFGACLGIIPAFVGAAIIASLYERVPKYMSTDYAVGMGVGLALFQLYIHWGKMQFLHKI